MYPYHHLTTHKKKNGLPDRAAHRTKMMQGQMFVGVVLIIGSVVALVGLLLLFLSGTLVSTSYGVKANAAAQAAATAGAEDAILKLERGALTFPADYSISVNGTKAYVTAGDNEPSAGFVSVTSTATSAHHIKTIHVVLSVGSNSQVSVVGWHVE